MHRTPVPVRPRLRPTKSDPADPKLGTCASGCTAPFVIVPVTATETVVHLRQTTTSGDVALTPRRSCPSARSGSGARAAVPNRRWGTGVGLVTSAAHLGETEISTALRRPRAGLFIE